MKGTFVFVGFLLVFFSFFVFRSKDEKEFNEFEALQNIKRLKKNLIHLINIEKDLIKRQKEREYNNFKYSKIQIINEKVYPSIQSFKFIIKLSTGFLEMILQNMMMKFSNFIEIMKTRYHQLRFILLFGIGAKEAFFLNIIQISIQIIVILKEYFRKVKFVLDIVQGALFNLISKFLHFFISKTKIIFSSICHQITSIRILRHTKSNLYGFRLFLSFVLLISIIGLLKIVWSSNDRKKIQSEDKSLLRIQNFKKSTKI